MTSGPANGDARPTSVLLALSREQREAFEPELRRLAAKRVELVFEESAEDALEIAKKTGPALVIVGMTVGAMEGLEFVALLLGKSSGFRGKVVVLPDKGDPFPPVLQSRDPSTGKSTTESIDFATIESLVAALAPAAPASTPGVRVVPRPGRAAPPRPVPRVAANEGHANPSPITAEAPSTPANLEEPLKSEEIAAVAEQLSPPRSSEPTSAQVLLAPAHMEVDSKVESPPADRGVPAPLAPSSDAAPAEVVADRAREEAPPAVRAAIARRGMPRTAMITIVLVVVLAVLGGLAALVGRSGREPAPSRGATGNVR